MIHMWSMASTFVSSFQLSRSTSHRTTSRLDFWLRSPKGLGLSFICVTCDPPKSPQPNNHRNPGMVGFPPVVLIHGRVFTTNKPMKIMGGFSRFQLQLVELDCARFLVEPSRIITWWLHVSLLVQVIITSYLGTDSWWFWTPRVPTIEPQASQMPRKRKIAIWFILMATAACKNFSLFTVWSFCKTFTESEHEKKIEIYKKTQQKSWSLMNGGTLFSTERRLFSWLGFFTSQPTCERIGNIGERWRAMTLIRISWMSCFFMILLCDWRS